MNDARTKVFFFQKIGGTPATNACTGRNQIDTITYGLLPLRHFIDG